MAKQLSEFKKQKEFLVCIDSDGTAIDSMTSKHKLCFGPCFIKEWNLDEHYNEVLKLWCDINLHGKTRGKNRFITFYLTLEKLNGNLVNEDLSALKDFTENSPKLSNDMLEKKITETNDRVLKKALSWSIATNQSIAKLSFDDKKAFEGVKEFLKYAGDKADIAVVSSANFASVLEEWQYFNLYEHVSVLTTQENGTKTECIEKLAALGYDKSKIIMLGDAPMDLQSAEESGVLFYPIFPEKEVDSWRLLKTKFFAKFIGNSYESVQSELIKQFLAD